MAYVSKETKASIVAALEATGAKKEGFSWTTGVEHHSTIKVRIRKVPDWFKVKDVDIVRQCYSEYGCEINTYHPGHMFDVSDADQAKSLEWIEKFIAAMDTGNWDKSEPMTDYFNVGWYKTLRIVLKKG